MLYLVDIFFNASGVENSLEFSFFEYLWNLGEIVQVVKGKIVMVHAYASLILNEKKSWDNTQNIYE